MYMKDVLSNLAKGNVQKAKEIVESSISTINYYPYLQPSEPALHSLNNMFYDVIKKHGNVLNVNSDEYNEFITSFLTFGVSNTFYQGTTILGIAQ